MKILINDIEKKIQFKLKRNFKSLGCDTAQTTGLVFLKTDNEYLYLDYSVLGFKTKNSKEIYHTMVKTFEKMFENDSFAVIESVFVGFSRAGSVELAKYGAFAIAECIKKDMEYDTISASSARAKFQIDVRKYGKGQSKKAVNDWIKTLGISITDNNIADAFVLALLGIIDGMDFRSATEIAEEKKLVKKLKTKKKRKKTCKRH